MKIGRFNLVEIDGSFAPDNGVYWNTTTNRIEVWRGKELDDWRGNDGETTLEDWIDWSIGKVKYG